TCRQTCRTQSVFSLLLGPPPIPTLFPYTTLFRSTNAPGVVVRSRSAATSSAASSASPSETCPASTAHARNMPMCVAPASGPASRSEEHTSELQSRENLVCRLLLEKKNNITTSSRL